MKMKISLDSKSSFPQNELYRSSLLQERCLVSEQRQTVRGPFPFLPRHPDASTCFVDDSDPIVFLPSLAFVCNSEAILKSI